MYLYLQLQLMMMIMVKCTPLNIWSFKKNKNRK